MLESIAHIPPDSLPEVLGARCGRGISGWTRSVLYRTERVGTARYTPKMVFLDASPLGVAETSSPGAHASRRNGPRSTDLLDLLSAGEPPAFASDQNHRIIFWNKGAERVTERRAADALGRLCHDVFSGRDLFGNRFCSESCPVSQMINRNEAVSRFEMQTGDRLRPKTLGITIVKIPDPGRGLPTAVHLLDQIQEKRWLARELAGLTKVAGAVAPGGLISADRGSPIRLPLSPSTRASVKGGKPGSRAAEQLSGRELDVLRAIASGQANRDIAVALHISVATTRNHVQGILKKLNVHTKLEAMALAVRNGWA